MQRQDPLQITMRGDLLYVPLCVIVKYLIGVKSRNTKSMRESF
jgi:hypothetical protein